MCGINGFDWSDTINIKQMNDVLRHRGPDGEGVFIDGEVSLGHRRLSIIDLSEKGRQPMSSSDGSLSITYNGEIYNFRLLRGELESKGYQFRSATDTEVILNCFKEEGVDCFEKFNGIFAFCLYDRENKCLYLVRDRLGVKPLYFYHRQDKFIFSSEIKAFTIFKDLVPGNRENLNKEAVREYFLTKNIAEESFFRNIKILKPGHYLKFDLRSRKLKERSYFDLYSVLNREHYMDNNKRTEKSLINELDVLLNKVVKDQLISDAPLGSICSGGLDSSLITAIASKYTKNLKIFNIRVAEKGHDESGYAQKVAQHLGLELVQEDLDQKKYLQFYKKCIVLEDLPLLFPNSVGIYLVSKRAKEEGMSVLLTGEGSDEMFGGYSQYSKVYRRLLMHRLIERIRKNDIMNAFLRKGEVIFYTKDFTDYLIEDGNHLKDYYKSLPWVIKRHQVRNTFFNALSFLNNDFQQGVNSYILKDLRYYLVPLLRRTDRMSMGTGIEMRTPYLDNRLVDFAVNLPLKYKIGFFKRKYLLKKVAERYLPRKIVYRQKMGFSLPIRQWLRKEDFKEAMYSEWEKVFFKNNSPHV